MNVSDAIWSPSPEDVAVAQKSARLLDRMNFSTHPPVRVRVGDQEIAIPPALAEALNGALRSFAGGRAVAVVSLDEEVSPNEAAQLLGVSRPFAAALFDRGAFPSRRVGTHRRALLRDVLEYKEREKAARLRALEELAAEGQKLGL